MDAIHTVESVARQGLGPSRAGSDKLISRHPRLSAPLSVHLESPAFEPLGEIPVTYTAEGEGISPPLYWSGVPDGTRELLLICENPDAPKLRPFIHWIVYGISAERNRLPAGVPNIDPLTSMPDVRQAPNSLGQIGYFGPLPYPGLGLHHYHFQLFALDEPIRFNFSPNRDDLVTAMSGHVLATGELVGTYEIR